MKLFSNLTYLFLWKAKSFLKCFGIPSMLSKYILMSILIKRDSDTREFSIFKNTIFNCCVVSINPAKSFQEIFDMLSNANDLIFKKNKPESFIGFIDLVISIVFETIFILSNSWLIFRDRLLK